MKNKFIIGLVMFLCVFGFMIDNNLSIVNASTDCLDCTEDEMCEWHSSLEGLDDLNVGNQNGDSANVDGKPIEIVDDDNDEGITLLGNEDNNSITVNGKPVEIVDDENDEGITLLGESGNNDNTGIE